MSNPYNQDEYMTYIVKQELGLPFNPKLEADGKPLTLCAASIHHETNVCRRLEILLRRVISESDHIDTKFLNEIGFSKADADYIQIDSDGLVDINPMANWEDDL